MIDVVDELGLHARLADALLEHSGPEGRVLARALAHEHGEELSGVGISAAAWADELTSSLALLSAA